MSRIDRTPFYFGPEERSLFGWLHTPCHSPARSWGVVVCNPLGYEYICAHRTVRAYADALANAGFAALRFDYDGTGDSAGSDEDPDRVDAWTHSIEQACRALRDATGVEGFVLLGIRAGALLAAAASRRLPDVKAVALHAPVPSARGYLRELRALRAAMGQPPDAGAAALETAGFSQSPQTREALGRLDYDLAPQVEDLLIIDRDDLQSPQSLIQKLHGPRRVQHSVAPGYAAMMSDPHNVVVPAQAISVLVQWLSPLAPATKAAAPAHAKDAPRSRIFADASGTVTERLLQPATAPGFGIVAQPAHTPATSRVVFLLNAGSVHHVGPSRLYVDLARDWAQRGVTVVRFDLPGIGDSDPNPGASENTPYPEAAVADIEKLCQEVHAATGLDSPMLLGLCSGAYHALKAGLETPSGAVVMINPLTFYYSSDQSLNYPDHRVMDDVNRYRRSVLQAHAWRKLFTGRVDLLRLTTVLLKRASAQLDSRRRDLARALGFKLHQDLGSDLKSIAGRGTRLHFIFSRGDPGFDLLRIQGGAAVDQLLRSHHLSIDTIDGADHTFTARAPRTILHTRLTELVLSDQPPSPAH